MSDCVSEVEILYYDAILKLFYKQNYNIDPDVLDKIPIAVLEIWQKIALEEVKKKNTMGNNDIQKI